MHEFSTQLRSSDADVTLGEALQLPVVALRGVTAAAGTARAAIGIDTIFDLGSSAVFGQAASLGAGWRTAGPHRLVGPPR